MGFPKIRHSLACELIVVLLAMVSPVAVVMAALAVAAMVVVRALNRLSARMDLAAAAAAEL